MAGSGSLSHPLIEQLIESRQKLDFESIDFSCVARRMHADASNPLSKRLHGSEMVMRYRYSPEVVRVDVADKRPNDSEGSFDTSLARLDGVWRVIPTREKYTMLLEAAIEERTDEEVLEGWAHLLLPPAKLGIWPSAFDSIYLFTYDQLREMFSENDYIKITENTLEDGAIVLRGEASAGPPFWWEIEFLPDRNLPKRFKIFGRSGVGVADELTNTWTEETDFLFPVRSVYSRYLAGGKVLYKESWDFQLNSVDGAIEESVGSWEEMGIWEDAAVNFVENGVAVTKQFRGGAFGEYRPELLFEGVQLTKPAPLETVGRTYFLSINLAIMGILVIAFGLRKLLRIRKEISNEQ